MDKDYYKKYYASHRKQLREYSIKLKLSKGITKGAWFKLDEDDIQYIKDNYPYCKAQEIADWIGCSASAVYKQAKKLNLRKNVKS